MRCRRSTGLKPAIVATGLKFMLMPSEPPPNLVSWNTKKNICAKASVTMMK